MILKLFRCASEACKRLGYHASGTVIVRPSSKSTVSESSVTRTPVMRSPALGSEVLIPFLQASLLVLCDQPFDLAEFMPRVAKIVGDSDRLKPDLRCHILTIDMHMGWLSPIMTREVDVIWSDKSNGWHVRRRVYRAELEQSHKERLSYRDV